MLTRRHRTGASLMEMLITIALMCVLAGLATPVYQTIAEEAKASEACEMVDGIKSMEEFYRVRFDAYVEAPSPSPYTAVGPVPVSWDPDHDPGFDTIGLRPDGLVRCRYSVVDVTTADYLVQAECDIDGDGNVRNYTATRYTNCTLDPTDANVY